MVRSLTLLLALGASAVAKPVDADPMYAHLRIIAPAGPGGGWDQTARAMQQVLQQSDIVETASVENIPGAAGTIGLARLLGAERGKGDVTMVSGLIMLGAIASYHSPVTLRDVTPIARLTGEYEVVVVPAASPYRTLTDLLDAFRARPESIAWAGGSAGGTDQILAGLIADAVGVSPRRVNYVAFAGGGESMAAVLGGQVTAGISGLGEFAPQIAAGTVRVLAISSDARLPDVQAPTLREQGVEVVLENWRSLVGPPGMGVEDRARLDRAVAAMVSSTAWQQMLRRYGWSDRYLAGAAFARFVLDEEARVASILDKLGVVAAPTAGPASVGFYPIFVLAGFALCVISLTLSAVGARRDADRSPLDRAAADAEDRPSQFRAVSLIALGIAMNVLLLERAGFVVASVPLFWLTARAFDGQHPRRDVIVAVALSLGTYLLFARLLQVSLPAGVLAPWL
ncbi:MAG: tripartite tricarboxylate transporter TctB family protein [Acidobacteria bacterium]|nr:tripartite tricarboxylate transporter TctB family protein [Acidobacteriota bacterium]